MTLKQLEKQVNKTNEFLKQFNIDKEVKLFIRDEDSLWGYQEFNEFKQDMKECGLIKEVKDLLFNTEIVDNKITFEFTWFKGWKELEETKTYTYSISVE